MIITITTMFVIWLMGALCLGDPQGPNWDYEGLFWADAHWGLSRVLGNAGSPGRGGSYLSHPARVFKGFWVGP